VLFLPLEQMTVFKMSNLMWPHRFRNPIQRQNPAGRNRVLQIALLLFSVALQSTCVRADSPLWIAIYDHSGGAANGPKNLERFLTREAGFRCERVHPDEIQAGRLAAFDVLIVPGGSGSKQAKNLGEVGRENVRKFVADGKGYVGICAGSYLASSDYEWSLHLLNAKVRDRSHWARGTGEVMIKMRECSRDLWELGATEIAVYYGQGPLLIPDTKAGLPAYESLAEYASEIAKNGAPQGVMIGTTAIARAHYGQGRVICYSPHPEVSQATEQFVLSGVRWASGKVAGEDARRVAGE
jgi:glutamine amidotransferase-like uncharacterized protein